MAFKYYENDYELAVLELFKNSGYAYQGGYDIHREGKDILISDDFLAYLNSRYGSFSNDEIYKIISNLTSYSNQSLYRSFKETYNRLIKGYNLRRDDNSFIHIEYIDFEDTSNNIYKVVNQFEFTEFATRRPDICVFINGIPVSIIELKNPADESVSIHDAFQQTHIRYSKDIPSLMKFDFINVISDGANTRYGSIFSSYEFYFKWNSKTGYDYSNSDQFDSLERLVEGLFDHRTLLRIIKYYIYIPDNNDKEIVVIPKYYQYYGTEKMFSNIKNVVTSFDKSLLGKGGTYWGATGCGKSYMMLFLSKRITTDIAMEKPTIIIITDRNDLDDQISLEFENAKEYLIDNNALRIKDRDMLREKIKDIQSGGIFLITIQKFSEDISLLSERTNIICISDEAHRTQTNVDAKYISTNKGMKKSFGFAKYLRDSFPNATYVGYTGTPIDATIRVFGKIVDKYTMKQSLDDGSTVGIDRLPGPREVQLDEKIAELCDEFYRLQLDKGANEHQVEASKKEMTRIKTILGNDDRLDIVVNHFVRHYEYRLEENSTINGKAMLICYDREIAFKVHEKIKKLRPQWFVKKKCDPKYENETLGRDAVEIEKVKIIATTAANDSKEMLEVLGNSKDRKKYAQLFKDVKSNFKIAILVDMWITGFDVPSLDTLYLDKPVESHNLIQTISRVNRVFKGKERGLIVDYIGLEGSIARAMKMYNGDISPVNNIEVSLVVFKDFLSKIDELMNDFDFSKFLSIKVSPLERMMVIQKATEFVIELKQRETNFMGFTLRAKKAFDICVGHELIAQEEIDRLHFYLCVRSVIYKMTIGDTPDATLMNNKIRDLVNRAISSAYDGVHFDFDGTEDMQDLFSEEFLEKIKNIPFPNTKYQSLVKLLKKAIKEFGRTNILKATQFSQRLRQIIDKYNSRDELSDVMEIIEEFVDNLSDELTKLYRELRKEKESFEAMNISYDEKSFFDILVSVAEKYSFRNIFTDEQLISIAKEIKKLIGSKSKYTDWTNRQDVKDELYADIAKLLYKNGYPPQPIDEAYDEILRQVENFKKYH